MRKAHGQKNADRGVLHEGQRHTQTLKFKFRQQRRGSERNE